MEYLLLGSPSLAHHVRHLVGLDGILLDPTWGLDHGTWSILTRLFPNADVLVVQGSLDIKQDARAHYDLGKKMKDRRREGVLIIASGNSAHCLRMMVFEDTAFDRAVEFDGKVKKWILEDDHEPILNKQE